MTMMMLCVGLEERVVVKESVHPDNTNTLSIISNQKLVVLFVQVLRLLISCA